MLAAYSATCKELAVAAARWKAVLTGNLNTINAALEKQRKEVVKAEAGMLKVPSCGGGP
jgi:hypothetical protein